MKDQLNLSQSAGVEVGRSGKPSGGANDKLALRGEFAIEHWRDGELLATYTMKNGITTEGKNAIFDKMFDGDTQITAWYMGLIDLTNYTALAATDTADNIDQAGNDWDEYKTYTDNANASSTVTRPEWTPDAASAASISNGTQTIFDMTGTGTVKGLFIVGGGTTPQNKGNHTADGTLWATALFDQGDTAVVNSDQLKITYTISA